jgi:hypothetical protein
LKDLYIDFPNPNGKKEAWILYHKSDEGSPSAPSGVNITNDANDLPAPSGS